MKIARQQIDQTLKETLEFNERILDPDTWAKKLRKRQIQEMKEIKHIMDERKAKLLINDGELSPRPTDREKDRPAFVRSSLD